MKPAKNRWYASSRWLISLFFVVLLAALVLSLGRYWKTVLEPRLRDAANTQAQTLAQAQATVLAIALQEENTDARDRALQEAVHRILLATDPGSGGRLIRGFTVQLDYELINAEAGSLDRSYGEIDCKGCFNVDTALIGREDELLGVAGFQVGDEFFVLLSSDMQGKLYTETALSFALLVVVWVLILVLFKRLERARQLLETSNLAKTRFMANVSHELRTPLNAILGYTHLYQKDRSLMERYANGIQTIDRSAQHLLLMINDVLDFSKADSDKLTLSPKEVVLEDFLDGLVEMSRVRARLKDIAFVHERYSGLPATVLVDPTRLRQILLNLLNNAIKFTAKGVVTFRVTEIGHGPVGEGENVMLRFDVCDTGIGIPKDQWDAIFVPFQQLDNAHTQAEGTGLGLTISRKLVDLMGGNLNLDSTPGKGSTFWFALSLPVAQVSAPRPEVMERVVSGYIGQPRRLLSVDDNAYNRDVMRHTLEQWGFDVEEAEDGRQAVERVNRQQPDLVLMDLIMPDMDGFAALEAIRATHPDLPVVAVTASMRLSEDSQWAEAGFSDFLTKPIEEAALLDTLQRHLHLQWIYRDDDQPAINAALELPPQEVLKALAAHARRHNILDLRGELDRLTHEPRFRAFVEQMEPLVRGYQFKRLLEILQAHQTD
ncbi:MAG: response regulator [Chromatiales bacterium]|nr:response regulator [Chromatiales bacterium]